VNTTIAKRGVRTPLGVDPENDLSAWDVTLWAREVLEIIDENMLAQYAVNRDFEPQMQQFGETINARLRGDFKSRRKGEYDDVEIQKLTGTTIPLVLNQLAHVSFRVTDWSKTKTFADITSEYLEPAALALVKGINRTILGMAPFFISRNGGKLGGLTPENARTEILTLEAALQTDQDWGPAPCFIDTETRSILLDIEDFTSAEKIGDDGTAIRNASLGRKLGFDWLKTSNGAGQRLRLPDNTTAINLAAGYAKGTTVVAVDDGTQLAVGEMANIGGKPYRVTAIATNDVTIAPGLYEFVADDTAVTSASLTAIDGAQVTGHTKAIALDATAYVGDILNIEHTDATIGTYTVVDVDGSDVWLDRPLDKAIADAAAVAFWPMGSYNLALEPDAIMMASRPLPAVPPETGAKSVTVNYDGMTVRITMSYEGRGQAMLVTMDILYGLKVLREEKGGVLFG